ncbi:MAG: hypothetical protein DRP42_00095 [Tenericutes bacterium]|nr:MAG: hypothetical protein DRP42_00095 [Mycoplasmatota bacterium]
MNNKLDNLTSTINNLPGMSRRSSQKLATSLIENNRLENIDSLKQMVDQLSNLYICERTNVISSDSISKQSMKNHPTTFIVNTNNDYSSISDTLENVSFFVLGLSTFSKGNINIVDSKIQQLIKFISTSAVKEVVFALTPNMESELLIKSIISTILLENNEITFSRIGVGIPFGGSVSNLDEKTLEQAVSRREKL